MILIEGQSGFIFYHRWSHMPVSSIHSSSL